MEFELDPESLRGLVPATGSERLLSEDERRSLLLLARGSIAVAVTGFGSVDLVQFEYPAATGVFVTLKRQGRLRGCLGTLQIRLGLAAEIVRCAAESAREDPRFPPVAPDELSDLALEISVLGPLEPIDASPDRFTIGVHGLVAEHGQRRGLLLPQVAVEWGWTPEQFLRHTCVKAGLAPDAWRRGASIYRFAAEVFGD